MNESFVFYKSFADAIDELPAEQYKAVMTALTRYALKDEEPDLDDPIAKALFTLMKPQVDANNKRRTSGQKGGRPKKEASETESTIEKTNGFENKNHSFENENHWLENESQSFENEKPNVNVNVNANANANANVNANANIGACAQEVQEKLEEYFDFLEQLDQRPLPEMKKAVIVKKLLSLSREPTEQVALIQNAISNGYKNVYPIKPRASGGSKRLTSAEARAFLDTLSD